MTRHPIEQLPDHRPDPAGWPAQETIQVSTHRPFPHWHCSQVASTVSSITTSFQTTALLYPRRRYASQRDLPHPGRCRKRTNSARSHAEFQATGSHTERRTPSPLFFISNRICRLISSQRLTCTPQHFPKGLMPTHSSFQATHSRARREGAHPWYERRRRSCPRSSYSMFQVACWDSVNAG
jgi:hypothetical protein